MRVGQGFDLHRLGADRPLILGGIRIPDSPGLIGHSDADCVLHALADALLGAAGLPADIGTLFPDDDPQFADADSGGLLKEVVRRVGDAGYRLVNADLTVLAERPRLAPYRAAMRERIAALVGLGADALGLKFTTLETLGALGRGEGIACMAICLLQETGSQDS